MRAVFHLQKQGQREQYEHVEIGEGRKKIFILSYSEEELGGWPVTVHETVKIHGTENKYFATKVSPLYSKVVITTSSDWVKVKVFHPITLKCDIEYEFKDTNKLIRTFRRLAANPYSLGWQTESRKKLLLNQIYREVVKTLDRP